MFGWICPQAGFSLQNSCCSCINMLYSREWYILPQPMQIAILSSLDSPILITQMKYFWPPARIKKAEFASTIHCPLSSGESGRDSLAQGVISPVAIMAVGVCEVWARNCQSRASQGIVARSTRHRISCWGSIVCGNELSGGDTRELCGGEWSLSFCDGVAIRCDNR